MAKKSNSVRMNMHTSFFDNVFEPERRKLSKKIGMDVTQVKFTEFLAKSNAKITYPKIRSLPIKRGFAPRRRKGRFTI